ncbi:hypothetical protein BIT28_24515 [Photobacterium proteolyticum]|uniref:Outer membrane protein beta-barrel domain-containing protein n=1 Tax=Photobacterium proteolyticum TaxID=1903952 RepID=A0A1Q9GCZ6_9GAMM|nr:outer membrane beta-barrel protein [Photobacterium proteolyticum]OLQ72189.1 hypothetical protein BIT28_24515 [Photobacterium proteolyticum]
MNKCVLVMLLLISSSVMAEINSGRSDFSQDVYLSAGLGSHDLERQKSTQLSALFGARNYYRHNHNWFIGGEFESSYHGNEELTTEGAYSISVEEKFSLGANIPVGKRFSFSGDFSVDAYGLFGYSMTRLKACTRLGGSCVSDSNTVHGPKWGLGVDASFPDYMIGARWTRVNLDGDYVNDALREENITLLLGYKF